MSSTFIGRAALPSMRTRDALEHDFLADYRESEDAEQERQDLAVIEYLRDLCDSRNAFAKELEKALRDQAAIAGPAASRLGYLALVKSGGKRK